MLTLTLSTRLFKFSHSDKTFEAKSGNCDALLKVDNDYGLPRNRTSEPAATKSTQSNPRAPSSLELLQKK